MDAADFISRTLCEGLRTRVFPGAVLFVRHKGQICVHQAIGQISSRPDSPSVQTDTIYDLASLTKPLVTVSSFLLLVHAGRLDLSQPLATFLEETQGAPLGRIALGALLSHQSGLPAWRPFYQSFSPIFSAESEFRQHRTQDVLEMILKEPIDKPSLKRSLYSDLGYMLLGFVIERMTSQSLAEFSQKQIFKPLEAAPLCFGMPSQEDALDKCAPSEEDPWRGRFLQGEVHDENAAALGGIAGHAGLFGSAQAVGQVTQAWLDAYTGKPSLFRQDLVRKFVQALPGTSWGLGWDTPSSPSSSGQWFSPESFGHLGFTGTSIWIDPVRELEVIFLSNRVHPTRDNQAIRAFRPKLHDAIIQDLEQSL